MKFAITNDHLRFYRDNGWLALETFLSVEQQRQVKDGIEAALLYRLGPNWKAQSADTLFFEGHNLHCDSDAIRRVASQRRLASVIAELFDCLPLRLGCDLFLPSNGNAKEGIENPYGKFLKQEKSLKDFTSIQGTCGALLLCIEAPLEADPEGFFPSGRGEAVLVGPNKPLNLSFLNQKESGAYLLVTYAEEIAIYLRNEKDPHLHSYKKWGYAYGDKLGEPHHPIILR